jgi:hypothetical protein
LAATSPLVNRTASRLSGVSSMLAIFLAAMLFGLAFCGSPAAVFSETLRCGLTGGFRPALLV